MRTRRFLNCRRKFRDISELTSPYPYPYSHSLFVRQYKPVRSECGVQCIRIEPFLVHGLCTFLSITEQINSLRFFLYFLLYFNVDLDSGFVHEIFLSLSFGFAPVLCTCAINLLFCHEKMKRFLEKHFFFQNVNQFYITSTLQIQKQTNACE